MDTNDLRNMAASILDKRRGYPVLPEELDEYLYPKAHPSTAPCGGGIGGAMVTTQYHRAFADQDAAVVFCAGRCIGLRYVGVVEERLPKKEPI